MGGIHTPRVHIRAVTVRQGQDRPRRCGRRGATWLGVSVTNIRPLPHRYSSISRRTEPLFLALTRGVHEMLRREAAVRDHQPVEMGEPPGVVEPVFRHERRDVVQRCAPSVRQKPKPYSPRNSRLRTMRRCRERRGDAQSPVAGAIVLGCNRGLVLRRSDPSCRRVTTFRVPEARSDVLLPHGAGW
jgi:hypothetical protein